MPAANKGEVVSELLVQLGRAISAAGVIDAAVDAVEGHIGKTANGERAVERGEQREGIELRVLADADGAVGEVRVAEFVLRRRADGAIVGERGAFGDVPAVRKIAIFIGAAV